MPRIPTRAQVALACFGLLALASAAISSQQSIGPTHAIPTTCRHRCWPPPPEDMVRIDSVNHPAASTFATVDVPGLSHHVVYSVPSDRHFVLTEFGTSHGDALFEIDGSTVTVMARTGFNRSGGPGIAFAPGSDVSILNHFAFTNGISYVLIGYLD